MARYTAPNKQRVDDAYPVRIKVRFPPDGLGYLSSGTALWLKENLSGNLLANQSTRIVFCEVTAFYCRTLTDAQGFLDAFPALELADEIQRAVPPD